MRTIFTTVAVLALALGSISSDAAQRRGGGMPGQAPRYDRATEVTLPGTVQEVKQVTEGMGMHAATGTHVVVKSDRETIEVHLGPSTFLASQKLVLEVGDVVEVVGSRVTMAGAGAVLAREVRKGDQTVTLRDEQGFPKWAGGGRP